MWETVSGTCNYKNENECWKYYQIMSYVQSEGNVSLTGFRAIWTLIRFSTCMLVGVKFQVLTTFECFHANVAFVRSNIAMRNLMLFQCAIRWIHSTACSAWKLFTRMILLVSLQIDLCFKPATGNSRELDIHLHYLLEWNLTLDRIYHSWISLWACVFWRALWDYRWSKTFCCKRRTCVEYWKWIGLVFSVHFDQL